MTRSKPQILIFGAGNIGRGLMGQLAWEAGCQPVFVEAYEPMRRELAQAGAYEIRLVGRESQVFRVEGFEVLGPRDHERIARVASQCQFAVTSVGGQHLGAVAAVLAMGLGERHEPLNILLCENWPRADAVMSQEMLKAGATPVFFACVPSSVERMVRRGEGLDLMGEIGQTLLIDGSKWSGALPQIDGLQFVQALEPYYKRKLYMNNAGHAALAYMGAQAGCRLLCEAMEQPEILMTLTQLLNVAAQALHLEYGLSVQELESHVESLMKDRFPNHELADTVQRVARSPLRKLGPSERLVGLLRLAQKHALPIEPICGIMAAAMHYSDPEDEECVTLQAMIREGGPQRVLCEVCHLNPDGAAMRLTLEKY